MEKEYAIMDEWIKYKDQQPEVGQKVIYYADLGSFGKENDFYYMFARGLYRGNHFFEGKDGFTQYDVTHWMPDEGQDLKDIKLPL